MVRWFQVAVGLVVVLATCPVGTANEFVRHYEASSTLEVGPADSGMHSVAWCPLGNRDGPVDTAGCVAYHVPGVYDFRGGEFLVRVLDAVQGADVWVWTGVDVDGDGRVTCGTADVCTSGQGATLGTIPAGATGTLLRVFPFTAQVDDEGRVFVATRGEIRVTFTGPV